MDFITIPSSNASSSPSSAQAPAPASGSPAPQAQTAVPGSATPSFLGSGHHTGTAPSSIGTVAAGLLLGALAVAAWALARRRRRTPRLVEIVESASLGPKRSLVVARLGDELLVLGSTEGGITLLATRPDFSAAAASANAPTSDEARSISSAISHAPRRSLFGFFHRLRPRATTPSDTAAFENLLAESVEDVELRRKLAAGQMGNVR